MPKNIARETLNKGIRVEEEEAPMLVKNNQKKDRTYNLGYLLRLTLMAAIGGFLFGYSKIRKLY